MSNYKDWIDAIEIKVDYFSAFMKAWIAFNAWYNSEITGRTDKERIDFIAYRTNRFKNYVINLLNADNSEAKRFRDNIANLHEALLNAPITTQEYVGMQQPISFSEVAIKNTNVCSKKDYYSYRYECIRAHGKITTTVSTKATGRVAFSFEQDEYDVDMLKSQSTFQALTQTQQGKCLECYNELKPYITESVLSTNPDQSMMMGAYGFVDDIDSISKAIVIILYMLRCCLTHGDITPDEATNKVYQYAYEVLKTPLKKLK